MFFEIFYIDSKGHRDGFPYVLLHEPGEPAMGLIEGWYWEPCEPGCLPDNDPFGPFTSEYLAIRDAAEID